MVALVTKRHAIQIPQQRVSDQEGRGVRLVVKYDVEGTGGL